MYPFLFTIPGLELRILSGPVMVGLGLAVGFWLAPRLAEAVEGLDRSRATRASIVLVLVALAGARLHFVWNHWRLFADQPWSILDLSSGGRHAPGAIAALVVATPIVCWRYALPFGRFADCGTIAVLVALAIARVGCFLHGCCFGTACDWPWCVSFPPSSPIYNIQAPMGLLPPGATRSLPVHPLQLYFAATALAIAALAWWMLPRRRFPGEVMLVALVLFSATSAALELLRYDYVGRPYVGGMPELLWATLVMTGVSTSLWLVAEAVYQARSRRVGARIAATAS